MRFKLFQQVALARDLQEKNLRRGDVATIVYSHPANGGEVGHSIEIFNAVGDTIAVTFEKKSFDSYMDLKAFLEELFHRRVDLVLADAIKPRLRENILKDAVYAPGL